jgi:hypothetical protein
MSYLWLIFFGWIVSVGVIAYLFATAPEGYEDEQTGFITGRHPERGPSPREVPPGTPNGSLAPDEGRAPTHVSQSARATAER